ncbi:uncharacterized protein MONOS_11777 [Monocercomonoides exilis]|uniref:uncharacterized protein n=1 Tax=Monocercomonoides exilis TaxID=2049356 RepID=UPI003559825F|nr:hypothetical protein MONOS_11777 [Monocercomonoides exilis]|eukprot:MONOS_11777.1-p1 / transcript=MONOS_11777.1 / gene=MONOS_11777 / organism=Monocercomonoides_exilis_PA203 / gene_product=unspecified product / transcript_product=unspecified product / location=Mono_scaffold00610:9902-10615(+) / protein_length=238 / sequence_SO=supercontig / SO=protein_coding / is_pseudo=false
MFTIADRIAESNRYEDENIPYNAKVVNAIGWNSSNFDNAFIIPYQISEELAVTSVLGKLNHAKQIMVSHNIKHIILRFVDRIHYVFPQTFDSFVKDFGDGSEEKGAFPHEAINSSNYEEVLTQTTPFPHTAFHSSLKGINTLIETQYNEYVDDEQKFNNRWDYFKYYNEQDTVIMIKPIRNQIILFARFKIDMIHSVSAASNAAAAKFVSCYFPSLFTGYPPYPDFDIHADYFISKY